MEERGGVSRGHWHLKQHGIKQRAGNRAYFDWVKRVFLTLPLRNVNQSMLNTFIKTLKNHINLWKMGIR